MYIYFIYSPLIILFFLICLSLLGKVSYGHGLGDILYLPLPFVLFLIHALLLYFINSSVTTIIFTVITLLLSLVIIIAMTVRRGPENSWRGPEIPFLSINRTMNKQTLKAFDAMIKKYPHDKELKQHQKEFLDSIKKRKK